MQCSSVADAHPKQFPSLSGAADNGNDNENDPSFTDIGVRGVAGSLEGVGFPDCSFFMS